MPDALLQAINLQTCTKLTLQLAHQALLCCLAKSLCPGLTRGPRAACASFTQPAHSRSASAGHIDGDPACMTLTQLNSLARHALSCSQPVCHHALAPRRPWASCSLKHWHQHAASTAVQKATAQHMHWPRHQPCQAASRCQRAVTTAAAVAEAAPLAETQTEAAPAPSFQAFLDWKALRADLQQHRDNVRHRNSSADPDRALALYDSWRQLEDEASRLRSDRNSNAKAMKASSLACSHASLPHYACWDALAAGGPHNGNGICNLQLPCAPHTCRGQ